MVEEDIVIVVDVIEKEFLEKVMIEGNGLVFKCRFVIILELRFKVVFVDVKEIELLEIDYFMDEFCS